MVICFFIIALQQGATAQTKPLKWYNYFSGNIESNTQLYQKDVLTNAIVPPTKTGSHNFAKLQFQYKGFSANTQLEAYLPSLQGYTFIIDGAKFTNNNIAFKKDRYGITLGDFYEQFGNGALLRAFENRPIGINNAIKGINVYGKPLKNVTLKFLHGKQRLNFNKSEGLLTAANTEVQILGNKDDAKHFLTIATSFVNRQQAYRGPLTTVPKTTNAAELSVKYNNQTTTIEGSYTLKGYDPHNANFDNINNGNSIFLNTTYTKNGLYLQGQVRRTQNMDFRTDRNATGNYLPINYIAPLTKPSDFSLVNIYVYAPQLISEVAAQLDAAYTFNEGTKIGGKYGSTLAFNAAIANSLKIKSSTFNSFTAALFGADEKYFNDINIDFTKKFTKNYTANFTYHNIFYNKSLLEGGFFKPIKANILIHQGRINLKNNNALRYEVQHLFTAQDKKNWAALQLEYTLAPYFTFFAGDMYNYGDIIKVHYYNFGSSVTYKKHKLIANYARQRSGLVCVGGVCRFVPASTGLNIAVQSSF